MSDEERIKLEKMTKAEILDHFAHLSSAVEAKDKEINTLKDLHQSEKESLIAENTRLKTSQKGKQQAQEETSKMIEALTEKHKRELEQLRNENAALKKEANHEETARLQMENGTFKELLVRRIEFSDSLLKTLQGVNEMGVEINRLYREKEFGK
jgi:hypothetical protein